MHANLEKYRLMKRIGLILCACIACMGAYAIVATPEPIIKTQADGSTISLKLVGDEFHSYYTREDGVPVRLNERGMWIEDATVAEQPVAVRQARRVAEQQQFSATFPLKGSPHSVVILVNFADLNFQYKREDFEKMLNVSGYSENGGVGSARDYFIANSDSIFSPIFDCYGPVTVSKNYAYYGGKNGNNNDSHVGQLVVEACNLVAEQGIDFTQYDTNNDGRIDNVFIYYAGHNEAEGASSNTIWPHRSIVSGSERVNGKLIYDYACTSELRGSSGKTMCGIGTFCHEFGHVLGLPDYYDTDGEKKYTIGTWDIMCSGGYNGNGKTPPSYTAGERFQLGWITPVQLEDAGRYTMEPIESGSKQIYLIAKTTHNLLWDASPNEYWLLENRQHVGWDNPSTALPGVGLFIWHVNYSASAWGNNTPNNTVPMRYDLEEAGGQKGFSSGSDPFPGSKNITNFTPILHSGEIVEQPLMDIEQDGTTIHFTFKTNGEDKFMFVPSELPVLQSSYVSSPRTIVTPEEELIIVGAHLDPKQEVSLSTPGAGFEFSTDKKEWLTEMTAKVEADSTMELKLYVHYAPNRQVCDIKRATLSIRQDKAVSSFPIYGTSPRPILITAPEVSGTREVTPTSFKALWEPVSDAEQYYVTLYHMEDGQESTMESFEGFDEEPIVKESGWSTSFYRTTAKAKQEGTVSMWFKDNDEWIESPTYPLPVVELSMWLNAPATTDSEVGFFHLIAYSDNRADTIDTIRIVKSTKDFTYTHSFEPEQGYRRFHLDYTSVGGEGVCLDAFTTTFNEKTIYSYKGREYTVSAEEAPVFYAGDLTPNTTYYVQLQCSEDKGCEEHLSSLGSVKAIKTKEGEAADSKHLTLAYDSISYDVATHVVYLPQAREEGSLCIYSMEGELVKVIPVAVNENVIPLSDDEFKNGVYYIVKYLPKDAMKRKNPSVKILFL